MAWAGAQLVAVGADGAILTSPDGIAWTAQSTDNTSSYDSVIWTGSQLVAVGVGPTTAAILTSPDGVTWTARQISGHVGELLSVAWTGKELVTVGRAGAIATSP